MVTKAQQAKLDAQAEQEAQEQAQLEQEATTTEVEQLEPEADEEVEDQLLDEQDSEPDYEEAEGPTEYTGSGEVEGVNDEAPLEVRLSYAKADLENLKREVAETSTDDREYHNLISAELAYLSAYTEMMAKRVAYTK